MISNPRAFDWKTIELTLFLLGEGHYGPTCYFLYCAGQTAHVVATWLPNIKDLVVASVLSLFWGSCDDWLIFYDFLKKIKISIFFEKNFKIFFRASPFFYASLKS